MEIALDKVDAQRGRAVPILLYRPEKPGGGLLLFSPGYGGTRQGYAYLARAWSQAGFPVAVVEHVGSNLDALNRLKQTSGPDFHAAVEHAARDPVERAARVDDLLFARDELQREFPGPLGVSGHSFGAATAVELARREPEKLGALLLMSPQPPEVVVHSSVLAAGGAALSTEETVGGPVAGDRSPVSGITPGAYQGLKCPTLVVTGTQDGSMSGSYEYPARLDAYHALPPGSKYLAVFSEADHMALAGVGLKLERLLPGVQALTTDFWLAALRGQGKVEPPTGLWVWETK